MLTAKLCVTTPNLLIQDSLNELMQAALYKHLPSSEHDGHGAKENKKFKKTVFWTYYKDNAIFVFFSSLDKNYEGRIAKAILKDEFRIGAVHISNSFVEIHNTTVPDETTFIMVSGLVCVYDKINGKRNYLRPNDEKFASILTNNIKQKYETLLNEPYTGSLQIKVDSQEELPTRMFYGKTLLVTHRASYSIEANAKMLNLILDTGLGSKIMQGCGWVNVSENVARRGGAKVDV